MKIEIIRTRRKTIGLKLVDVDHLQVRAPLKISQRQINELVKKYMPWVEKKSAELRREREQHGGYKFTESELFWYLGHKHPIKFIKNIRKIRLHEGTIQVPENWRHKLRNHLIAWYRQNAGIYIPRRVQELSTLHQLPVHKVGITHARTRWGSCSSKNSLNFSWRLLQAPAPVIDYVVCHELAHTKHRNHSPEFWHEVARLYPDYKTAEHWLKSHGRALLEW